MGLETKETEMPEDHAFLKFILPPKLFAAIESATREWAIVCPCGETQDLWDAGGVRFKGAGEPKQMMRCKACGKLTAHTVMKKTPKEA